MVRDWYVRLNAAKSLNHVRKRRWERTLLFLLLHYLPFPGVIFLDWSLLINVVVCCLITEVHSCYPRIPMPLIGLLLPEDWHLPCFLAGGLGVVVLRVCLLLPLPWTMGIPMDTKASVAWGDASWPAGLELPCGRSRFPGWSRRAPLQTNADGAGNWACRRVISWASQVSVWKLLSGSR